MDHCHNYFWSSLAVALSVVLRQFQDIDNRNCFIWPADFKAENVLGEVTVSAFVILFPEAHDSMHLE